jgi:hypothetical protein
MDDDFEVLDLTELVEDAQDAAVRYFKEKRKHHRDAQLIEWGMVCSMMPAALQSVASDAFTDAFGQLARLN